MADHKKSSEGISDESKALVKELLEGLVPQMVASVALAQKGVQAPSVQARPEMCAECGQHRKACNGEHVQICVLPTRRPEYAQWYQGYKLNGVVYLSDRPGHLVTVPKSCAQDILSGVRLWEDTEARMRQGKVREHHSGSVDRPSRVDRDGTSFL